MSADEREWGHAPVLCAEAIAGLALRPGGRYLDATLGAGGHAAALLAAEPTAHLVGLDCDGAALALAGERLQGWGDRVERVRANFADFLQAKPRKEERFDGILADLGVSSMQVDQAERGFSFRLEGPLDMRLDDRRPLSAAELVNTWDETELANVIYAYGEERLSRRIARAIAQRRADRPFATTLDLATVIAQAVPGSYRHGRIHPATRTFQALRIAVNEELAVIERLIDRLPLWLRPGGRVAIITFHSLEDRLVKHGLKALPALTVLTKKPLIPTPEEVAANPRARSAKLRLAEKTRRTKTEAGQSSDDRHQTPPPNPPDGDDPLPPTDQ